ncbi:LysM peptidoglycan-binding domain-containing protein [Gordonia sp. (in: high G+C Gram-positive bacteria)]|uniref:LysM peptidoglycan-binding domain-containing protein n=1 Tax=Gordonia sp. (in: high G+C Gram-positive bacteria) TaxID=84139 RepID=UPI003F9658E0
MSQALISKTVERRRRGVERPQISVTTCDIPVIGGASSTPIRAERSAQVCSPTGRDPRRARVAGGRLRSVPEGYSRRIAAVQARPAADRHASFRTPGERSNIDAVIRRRRLVGALAVGAILAGVVWLFTIVGSDYADASTPGVPGVTQVVHARSGESLSDIARRIATDLPVAGVVEQLRELNHLQSSGLRVGQPLIAPAY